MSWMSGILHTVRCRSVLANEVEPEERPPFADMTVLAMAGCL